ncbi:diguanylate cyclase (GGDEF) domain-containing protein [Saccharopolyspora antimicrobica]|uniref:Diguanylate cyclase (GGDEF) domain-containing protein n=1 Tax=Saccharopolyspora antimicrobica TaxID=455193 RepID=A0A1I4XBZ9_9PSEU|nr:GGDEF domain-containing protein [Saccharopolyspora antimicrobica]RKT84439.1 diguanylate cyclase (GGDEF)-like protein [Saccharopolyspora antimicrobica]SFN23438.1 diguanylate cyclase (GGDEF) domain-containing protein [Saccharopolyspora antimicrobica]
MSVVEVAASAQLASVWDDYISGLNVGVLLTDERGQVLATNDVAAELMQLSKSDLLTGVRPAGWRLRDDTGAAMPDWAELAGQVLRAGSPLSIPMVIARSGQPLSRIWADYHAVQVQGRRRVLILLQPVHTDVPHSRGLLDPLTGLPGRVLLLDRLEQSLVRARSRGTLSTLVLIDVQQLAAFNAEHGFDRGDDLLTTLAGRLREGLSDEHTVARYGGDEFAVVAEHPSGTGETIAEQAREVAGWPLRIGRKQVRPGLRVSWVTTDGQAPVHSVLARAEQQLQH